MTIENGILGGRFHFDLSARFSRSVEREYSSFSPAKTSDPYINQDSFYSRANSINVLEKALSEGLGKRIDIEINGKDYSQARTIASNVIDFVRQELREARSNGASEEELQSIISQAQQGIEQGFASAREALQTRLENNPQLERQIERAFDKIQRGLQRLDNRFAPNVEVSSAGDNSEAEIVLNDEGNNQVSQQESSSLGIQQVEFSKTKSIQQSSSFDLSIKTQEGDTVTLSIEKFYNKEFSKQALINEEGFTVNVDRQIEKGKQISYQVNGDINEKEQAAIDSLIKKIDRLADKFYSGNLAGAFQKATKVGIDSEQLASFSVNLQSSKIVEVTRTYKEVQGVEVLEPQESLIPSLGALIHQIDQAARDEQVAKIIAEPVPVATELFKQIAIRDERFSQLSLIQNINPIQEITEIAKAQLLDAA